MFVSSSRLKIYMAMGVTDMRKSINGLSILVQENMDLDPFSGHMFAFSNRMRNIIKILYWDRNGFCLWHKRLEKQCFRWPESREEILKISHRELRWLIDGLELCQQYAHGELKYTTVV